jgi:hypothetical protein
MPLFAIEGAIDDVAGVGQRRRQLTIEIRVVFNDEQAQAGLRNVSRQSRRLQDEMARRECRMNNDECGSLLFLHNRFFRSGRVRLAGGGVALFDASGT